MIRTLLVFIIISLLGCPAKGRTEEARVVCEDISDNRLRGYEYFVVYGNDTSAVSLFVTENKSVGFVKMEVINNIYCKRAKSTGCGDTPIKRYPRLTPYKITSCSGMMDELKMCLDCASLSFDFRKAHYLNFWLSDLGDVAIQTVNTLSRQGKRLAACRHHDIDAALARTPFGADISSIVARYSLNVKNIFSAEEMSIFPGSTFAKSSLLSPSLKVPKEMIGICICVELVHTANIPKN